MSTEDILAYLRKHQASDGGFAGWTSASIKPFKASRAQPTIFPTILILDCLQEVVGAEDIRLRAVKYLESQVSEQGSWNYWDRSSATSNREPYPDDLDDTACALAAITRADPKWVDGYRLGQFARLLIASEHQAGGPYNTWLINSDTAPQWRHLDIAVNANVGYVLSLHDVHLAGLTKYVDAAIQQDRLQSAYYTSEAAVLYFLSRWYDGERLSILRNQIEEQVPADALQTALLLSAGCRLDADQAFLVKLEKKLHQQMTENHWPGEALYVDPVYNKKQHYGGSAQLTTAFALEALTLYASQRVKKPAIISRKHGVSPIMDKVRSDAVSIANVSLRRRYQSLARRLMQDVAGEQITAPASLVAQAGGWSIPEDTLITLNAAGLNGWMAYTVYDDMLDGEAKVADIPVANVALRRSQQYFLDAVPNTQAWSSYVMAVFDAIDGANHWEQREARAKTYSGVVELRHLPDYRSHELLADRSLGHGLAACAVAYLHYGSLDHPIVHAMQVFFKHFLIARQLNDDAHDWEQDLRAGCLSAVVTLLLSDRYELPLRLEVDAELDALRQHFWQHTIRDVAVLIRKHLRSAQEALDSMDKDMQITVFAGWLDTLEASVAAALHGRKEALQFMQAYEGNHA